MHIIYDPLKLLSNKSDEETKIVISDVAEDSPKFEFAETEVAAAESVGVVSVPVKRYGEY